MKKWFPFALLMLAVSCGKSDELAPVITLVSPAENQAFTGGQTVTIQGTITDNEGIHMVHLQVTDLSTNGHMIHLEDHFDGKTYQLNKTFPTQAGRAYKIVVEAFDHAENTTKKEFQVSAN